MMIRKTLVQNLCVCLADYSCTGWHHTGHCGARGYTHILYRKWHHQLLDVGHLMSSKIHTQKTGLTCFSFCQALSRWLWLITWAVSPCTATVLEGSSFHYLSDILAAYILSFLARSWIQSTHKPRFPSILFVSLSFLLLFSCYSVFVKCLTHLSNTTALTHWSFCHKNILKLRWITCVSLSDS